MGVLTQEEIKKQESFNEELLPYLDALYNFGLQLTADPSDAEDLVQDTIVKAYRFYNSYDKGTNGRAWLFRILRNTFINNYRRKAKLPNKVEFDEEFLYPVSDNRSAYHHLNPENLTYNHLVGDEISRGLNKLPEQFRTVIILCDVEGFSYEEIANMLDVPIGTIRSRLHRGRSFLKEWLLDVRKN